ncbi:MAG: four helix bundle protein [Weeksellaceae bacterium]
MDTKVPSSTPYKVQSFTDLHAWKEAHQIVVDLYGVTKDFPKSEISSLAQELRDSSLAISNAIAKGYEQRMYKEKIQQFSYAVTSLTKLRNELYLAHDLSYVADEQFNQLLERTHTVQKMLLSFMKKAKEFNLRRTEPTVQ